MELNDFDLEQRVTTLFHDSVEAKISTIETLTPLIADAADMMTQCFLDDGKLMLVGSGTSGVFTQLMTANLISGKEKERPSLPAICLNTDAVTLGTIADENNNEIYSKQIRALGQMGDLLFVITTNSSSPTLVHAIKAAHDREIDTILLTGREGGDIASILTPEDLEICIPENASHHLQEIQLLTIHCLCDLIDKQIFGSNC